MTNRKKMQMLEVEPGCFVCGPPEWVEGAERRLVPTTRSEEGPEDAAQRSAEGSAVPPGEVSDEVIYQLLALWKSRVPEMEQRSRTAHHAGDGKRTVDALARADVYHGCAHELTMALVASRTAKRVEIDAAVQRKLADMMPSDSSDLDAKRSGRRNGRAESARNPRKER